MTITMDRPVLEQTETHSRPVHIPDPRDEWLALCGQSLLGTKWTSRPVDCNECLVLNELFDLSGAGGLEDDPDAE